MKEIQVHADIPLTDDQERRLKRMVYGQGHFDHEGGFIDAAGQRQEVAALHLCLQPLPETPGGETTLAAIDTHDFGEASPFLYLEDRDGKKTGWKEARGAIASQWHYGVILQDDHGDVWFCGIDAPGSGELTGDEPLRRISAETPEIVLEENGEILANLPADGEFWLSKEDLPKVTSIPWWGNLNPEDAHLREEARAPMRALLDRIQTRIREEISQHLTEPSL